MQHVGYSIFVAARRIFKLQNVESSSLTRDYSPALGVQSLSRWTTREVP